VREQKKQKDTFKLGDMEKQVGAITKWFDRPTKLWKTLEEDEQVQQWDKEEERVSASIQDLKQRQKTMSITERLQCTQDMKKLQSQLFKDKSVNADTNRSP
jgi:hypothetical protein